MCQFLRCRIHSRFEKTFTYYVHHQVDCTKVDCTVSFQDCHAYVLKNNLWAGPSGDGVIKHYCSCCTECWEAWLFVQAFHSASGDDIREVECIHIKGLKQYLHWPNSSVYTQMIEASSDFEAGESSTHMYTVWTYGGTSTRRSKHGQKTHVFSPI